MNMTEQATRSLKDYEKKYASVEMDAPRVQVDAAKARGTWLAPKNWLQMSPSIFLFNDNGTKFDVEKMGGIKKLAKAIIADLVEPGKTWRSLGERVKQAALRRLAYEYPEITYGHDNYPGSLLISRGLYGRKADTVKKEVAEEDELEVVSELD